MTRPRKARFSYMEVLGFMETPATVYDSRLTWVETEANPVVPAVPEKQDDVFSSWLPSDLGAAFLGKRIRWGMVASVTLVLALAATAAVWVYQRPAVERERARTEVSESIRAITPALAQLREANETIDSATVDGSGAAAASLAVDSGVRRVFEAAGGLTDADADVRTRIIAVSGEVAEAMRRFSDAVAVRSAVIPALAPPELLSDPGAISLEDAAAAFADWQARYESIRESLPETTFREVAEAMAALSANLVGHQRLYFDALADGDEATAAGAVSRVTSDLGQIEDLLMAALTSTKEEVDQAVAAAEREFDQILSLLG